MALDKINNKLEKQKLLTEKYATWSSSYRNSLKAENKLLDEKTAKIKTNRVNERTNRSR